MRRPHAVIAVAVVAFAVAMLPALPVTAAAAASSRSETDAGRAAPGASSAGLQVSGDGSDWSDALTEPLFAAGPLLVPGDSLESTVWLRNASDQVARLGFSATGAWATSAAFADELLLSAGLIGSGERGVVDWAAAGACAALIDGPLLQPGETVAVRVGVGFSATAVDREGAGDRAGVDFVAALRDPAVARGPDADCTGGTVVPGLADPPGGSGGSAGVLGSGSIAATGADLMLAAFAAILAGGLVATGILLLVAHGRARARTRPSTRGRP